MNLTKRVASRYKDALTEKQREMWYRTAMIELADGFSPHDWFEYGKGKKPLLDNWRDLDPELKQAIHETFRTFLPSRFFLYRWKTDAETVEEFQSRRNWGGYSFHTDPVYVEDFIKYGEQEKVRAFEAAPEDLMIHWNQPEVPIVGMVRQMRRLAEKEAIAVPNPPTLRDVPLEKTPLL